MKTPENAVETSTPVASSNVSGDGVDGTGYVGIVARSFNVCIGVLGSPGTGKSTYALARAIEYGKTPAYLLAHDQGWKLPDNLPNGRPTGLKRYQNFGEAQRGLASEPGGVHCISTVNGDAGQVIEYGVKLSAAALRANGGKGGPPTIILIDEVVSAADANPYRLGEGIRQSMALRRHQNVGIIWTAQSPRLCHYQMLAMGTELVCFRLHHKKDLDALEQVGLSDIQLDTIRTLPDHHFIIHYTR